MSLLQNPTNATIFPVFGIKESVDKRHRVCQDKEIIHTVYEPGSFTPLLHLSTTIDSDHPAGMMDEIIAASGPDSVQTILRPMLADLGTTTTQLVQQARAIGMDAGAIAYIQQQLQHLEKTQQAQQSERLKRVTLRYYLCDHLGTPQALLNQNGTIDWAASYDPWGNLIQEYNPHQLYQPIRLPGQHADADTGLYYNRHRYYDPQLGAYISQDPIGLRGGPNGYGYAYANPVIGIDPVGLETCLLTTSYFGVRDHAAIYTSRGGWDGVPAIYDPAGDFAFSNEGGTGDIVSGNIASIANYKSHHSPQQVEVTCMNTSKEEERRIIMNAEELPSAAPGQCAVMASSALDGIQSFPHVKAGTFWPGNLKRQVEKGWSGNGD